MYIATENRYKNMKYNRCGRSGIQLPAISLGLWHNFGGVDVFETGREIIWKAFDSGITHFDLANNYGPPPGSAEETFGQILELSFHQQKVFLCYQFLLKQSALLLLTNSGAFQQVVTCDFCYFLKAQD